jgi:DNA repair protein RecN (Recombination protein N)
MLDELHVRDYALVRDAKLILSPGCTVLTGETGAGKTALVGALKLLIGERGDVTAIRDGSEELVVEGRLILAEELTGDVSAEHIITRRVNREGRSRCTFDDGMVTVGALAEKLGPYVDFHGQHEHQSLLSSAVQRAYLDRYAAKPGAEALAAYQEAWDAHRAAVESLEALKEASQLSAATLALARSTVREMEAIHPLPDEYEELEASLPILRSGEALAIASQTALDALRDERGALDTLAQAQHALAQEAGVDGRLDVLAEELESLCITADDLAGTLRVYRESVEFDPKALETALSRLGELESLRKRFGPRIEDVFAAWNEATEQLALTSDIDERIQAAQAGEVQAAHDLSLSADALKKVRAKAAKGLAHDLSVSIQELAMEGASVTFSITESMRDSWTRQGSARYELMYKPSESNRERPLAKIASGGELSRVTLALKTLLKTLDREVTLVFDEVDAGIGGATASAVAERIRELSKSHQVLVVTHLAQIAAVADKQFVVEKSVEDGSAYTQIREVTGDERVTEIARMLAGTTDEPARAHARQLLGKQG